VIWNIVARESGRLPGLTEPGINARLGRKRRRGPGCGRELGVPQRSGAAQRNRKGGETGLELSPTWTLSLGSKTPCSSAGERAGLLIPPGSEGDERKSKGSTEIPAADESADVVDQVKPVEEFTSIAGRDALLELPETRMAQGGRHSVPIVSLCRVWSLHSDDSRIHEGLCGENGTDPTRRGRAGQDRHDAAFLQTFQDRQEGTRRAGGLPGAATAPNPLEQVCQGFEVFSFPWAILLSLCGATPGLNQNGTGRQGRNPVRI